MERKKGSADEHRKGWEKNKGGSGVEGDPAGFIESLELEYNNF